MGCLLRYRLSRTVRHPPYHPPHQHRAKCAVSGSTLGVLSVLIFLCLFFSSSLAALGLLSLLLFSWVATAGSKLLGYCSLGPLPSLLYSILASTGSLGFSSLSTAFDTLLVLSQLFALLSGFFAFTVLSINASTPLKTQDLRIPQDPLLCSPRTPPRPPPLYSCCLRHFVNPTYPPLRALPSKKLLYSLKNPHKKKKKKRKEI